MTLGPCRECGLDVSTRARRCPHCGRLHPETLSMQHLRMRYLLWPAVFVALVVFMYVHGAG